LLLLGVSLKTQELYALVFATRYLDLFTSFISLYNTAMKLIFLGSSFSIVWYIRRHKMVRRSYDKEHDTFRHQFIILPCILLALLIHEKFTFKEVFYQANFSERVDSMLFIPPSISFTYINNDKTILFILIR
jgi:ER lumen protein retaining receptor